jgi:hypothetical protein
MTGIATRGPTVPRQDDLRLLDWEGGYDAMRQRFAWPAPERFNIATAVCDKWADEPGRLALIHKTPAGQVERTTFGELIELSNRAANLFRVDSSGIAIMGGFELAPGSDPHPPPDAPVIRVGGFALMGGVEISVRHAGESARDAKRRLSAERKRLRDERKRLRGGDT